MTGFIMWLLLGAIAGFLGGSLAGTLVALGWYVRAPNAPDVPDRR